MVVLWAVMLLAFFTMSRKDNFSVEKIDACASTLDAW
jgi:hypothetical protein